MAQLKSTVIQGNLVVTDNVSIEGDFTTPGDVNAKDANVDNVYAITSVSVGDVASTGKYVALTTNGLSYEQDASNDYGILYFPHNKTGTILTDADVDSSYTPNIHQVQAE